MNKESKAKQMAKMLNDAQKMLKDIHAYQNEATYIEETGKKKEAQREIAKYEFVFKMKQGEKDEVEERK